MVRGRQTVYCKECKREGERSRRVPVARAPKTVASMSHEQLLVIRAQKAERVRRYRYRQKDARLAARIQAEELLDGNVLVAKWQKQQNAVSAPWNQLALQGDAMVSLNDLNKAMELGRTPCFRRPEEFIDFADPRFPAESEGLKEAPSAQEAEALCSTCPVWDLCERYAQTAKPDFGIYAGKVYVGGKVYKQKNKKEEAV